ncbi:MAG: hypothetical protein FDX21_05810 [Chlorobium sp.]|nr:MAG: hypothetical protein FDX21_05810 [Chlorobium sp.]
MYKVDIENKRLIEMTPVNFAEMKLTEPYDIEDWIEKTPKVLGEELLILTRQFYVPSGKKLDLLALDKKANLVIIELFWFRGGVASNKICILLRKLSDRRYI